MIKQKNKSFMFIIGICFFSVVVILIFLKYSNGDEKSDILGTLKDYNLIYINIDALRADHLGCYGYSRNTSPFIDSLAGEGLVFEDAFSNSSYTRESVSVLFTGKLPSCGGSTGWFASPSKKIKNIGCLFKESGYKTALLSVSVQLKPQNFRIGFQHFECLSSKWGVSRRSPELASRAVDFMEKNKKHKFLMYLHFLDPHGPYDPPKEFYQRFQTKVFPNPIKLYPDVRNRCHELIKSGFGPGDARFEDMILRYDGEIASVDNSVSVLFKKLKELNILDKTFVIISADHGEEFLDHNYVEHAWTLYNESLHVPLIFWAPEVIPASRIPERVSTVDVLPTILKIMGIPHQRKDFDGDFLFSQNNEGFYFTPPNKPYISELLLQHRSLLRAVIKDNWKYIAAQKWLKPFERPNALNGNKTIERNPKLHLDIWGPVVHEELYNLSTDPKEQHNLLIEKKLNEFRRLMENYKLYCQKKGIKDYSLKKSEKLSKEEIKRLKSLGYL